MPSKYNNGTKRKSSTVRRRLVFKRKRTTRRGRRSANFTSQSGKGGGITYKGKRTSRRAYKNALWNGSMLSTKYRSNLAANTTFNTPASIVSMSVSAVPALRFSGLSFWTTAGGTTAPDAANVVPPFTGNILLRGGKIGLRLTNVYDTVDAQRNTIQGTVYLIWTSKQFTFGALPGVVPIGWDSSHQPDFNTNIGRIVYKKEFLLRDADVANVEYRLKIRRIDWTDYSNERGQLVWLVLGGNVDSPVAHAIQYATYYNVSFTGDAV